MPRDEGFKIIETLPGSGQTSTEQRPAIEASIPAAPIGSVESAARVGRQLAERLDELGYHPVIVFGSSNSGKSSMLASLIAYLRVERSTGVEIALGEPLALEDIEYGHWAYSEAVAFFNRSVQEFLGGTAHAKTIAANPFFVPVVMRPGGNLPEARFAFLEGNGEWYQPKEDSHAYFQPLKEEVAAVLRHFQKGISVLHVAPYTQVTAWAEATPSNQAVEASEMGKANLGLVGAIDSYNKVRVIKERDTHLFLVTKWDVFATPSAKNQIFSAPLPEDVIAVAANKYQQSFAAFQNMNLGGENWQKQIMQYCSGIISGREILKPTAENREQLNRYPRTLWNWLYRNSTRDAGQSRDLFPPPPPYEATILDRFNTVVSKCIRWLGV